MTSGGSCPNPSCTGHVTTCTGSRWLRCPACRTAYDTHGHAYTEADWRPVDWRMT